MAKIRTLAQLGQTLDEAFAPGEGFSPEAVEDFYIFLKEARLMDQGIRLLDPDKFYWLDPVYRITRTELFDPAGRFRNGIVFRKAAQMGASTWSVAFMVWLCIDESRPLSIGSYWPTKEELQNFITTRLDPMLQGSPQLARLMDDAEFDNTQAKKIGRSTIYFRHVAGKSAMDAVPMDLVFCDEVRLWEAIYPGGAAAALERIMLRMGQSDIQLMILMSTTGIPEDYMEQRWFESNQTKYFSFCPNGCVTLVSAASRDENRVVPRHEAQGYEGRVIEGVVLSDFEPTRIVSDIRARTFTCPCCGGDIEDPQNGHYAACYPDTEGMFAIEFAQTLSKTKNSRPGRILERYLTAQDMKEFMNGVMAKPHLNAEGRPVKPEHWNLARERGFRAGLTWEYGGAGCYLGADFRHNQTHIVIGEPGEYLDPESGLIFPFKLAHLEVFEGPEWPERLDQLMVDFGVVQAIIDFLPDTNRTVQFAKRHEGRVLLAEYRNGDLMRLPNDRKAATRRVSPDGREEYKVLLDQVKSLSASLGAFASGQWLVPDGPLRQDFTDRKNALLTDFDVVEGMDGAGREGFKQHLMGLALRNVTQATQTDHREKVNKSGIVTQEFYDAGGFDPHFAHAFNYMVMATRADGGSAKLLKANPEDLAAAMQARQIARGEVAQAAPMTPSGKFNLAALGPQGLMGVRKAQRKCGGCVHGPREGRAICLWTGMNVGADEPACPLPVGYRARP